MSTQSCEAKPKFEVGDVIKFYSSSEETYWKITNILSHIIEVQLIIIVKISYTATIGRKTIFYSTNYFISKVENPNELKARYL